MYIVHHKGFSLVELMIAVAILTLMITVVAAFQRDVFYLSSVARSSLSSAQDVRNVVRVMAKELRSVSLGNNGSYPLVTAATSSLKFYSDTDADGLKEEIRYYLASSTLKRGSIKPTGTPLTYNSANELTSILAINVKNATSTPVFTYYDSSYTGTTSPMTFPVAIGNVRLVKITISIDADPGRSPILKTYTSQATLRNLKDNL